MATEVEDSRFSKKIGMIITGDGSSGNQHSSQLYAVGIHLVQLQMQPQKNGIYRN